MGNDGGSITKQRNLELHLQNDKEKLPLDDNTNEFSIISLWRYCRLSNKPLRLPLASDYRGNLYNKQSILEWLLSKDKVEYSESQKKEFRHIQRINDIVDLHNLDEISTSNIGIYKLKCKSGDDMFGETKSAFIYLVKCGCVFPKELISLDKKISSFKKEECPNCGKNYELLDIITLNATSSNVLNELEDRNISLKKLNIFHNGKQRKKKHNKRLAEDKSTDPDQKKQKKQKKQKIKI